MQLITESLKASIYTEYLSASISVHRLASNTLNKDKDKDKLSSLCTADIINDKFGISDLLCH